MNKLLFPGLAIALTMIFPDFACAEAPPHVTIRNVTYGGPGCPGSGVDLRMSPDDQSISLLYDRLVATAGPGIPITESYSQCTLNIELGYPQGWSLAVDNAQFSGHAQLGSGVTGTATLTSYVSGSAAHASYEVPFVGPIDRDFLHRTTSAVGNAGWSPCGESAPFNIRVSADIGNTAGSSAPGLLAVNHVDVRLIWRRCR